MTEADGVPSRVSGGVPAGYRLLDGPPPLADYLALRERSGLSPRRPDQAAAALNGGWAAVTVVHLEASAAVGMGRVIGDGGSYFHVIDMAVLPGHQRRGLARTEYAGTTLRDHAGLPRPAAGGSTAEPSAGPGRAGPAAS